MTASTVDEYLAAVPPDKRAALEQLRAQIRAAAPDLREVMAYGIPGYRLDGRYLLGFAAAANDCSFYPGKAPIHAHAAELAGYRLQQGTISFPTDAPLPADLVTRIVQFRVAERGPG